MQPHSMTVETNSTKQAAASGDARRKWPLFILKLAVAGGLLTWLFISGRLDFSLVRDVQRWGYLILAAVSVVVGRLLPVWRWLGLLHVQGLHVGWRAALRMTWLGYFASLFLPGAAGGDLAKAYAACRHQPQSKTRAVSTVLVDRIIGLHMLLFLGSVAGVSLLIGGARGAAWRSAVAWFPIVLLAVATVGLLLVLWPPTGRFMLRLLPSRFRWSLRDSLDRYRGGWRKMLGLWAFSGLCNIAMILPFYFAGLAMGMPVSLLQVLTVTPLVILTNTLPVSPGGLGVGEAAGSQLFMAFGLTAGAAIVLTVRLMGICASLPGALALLGRLADANPAHSSSEASDSMCEESDDDAEVRMDSTEREWPCDG